MSSIRVHLSDTERTCAIDSDEAAAWNQALIEQILFEAAKSVPAAADDTAVSATLTFRIAVDPHDGSLVIKA